MEYICFNVFLPLYKYQSQLANILVISTKYYCVPSEAWPKFKPSKYNTTEQKYKYLYKYIYIYIYIKIYNLNHTNCYLFNVNDTSISKIYSLISDIRNFNKKASIH